MNLRPSGYEPDELPGCSTPRHPVFAVGQNTVVFAFGKSWCDEPFGDRRLLRAHCLCNLSRVRVAPEAKMVGFEGVPYWFRPLFVMRRLCCVLQTWQRPTLPRLETKYHWRWGVSRPCSEWERVRPPRNDHQVGEAQHFREAGEAMPLLSYVLNTSCATTGRTLRVRRAGRQGFRLRSVRTNASRLP